MSIRLVYFFSLILLTFINSWTISIERSKRFHSFYIFSDTVTKQSQTLRLLHDDLTIADLQVSFNQPILHHTIFKTERGEGILCADVTYPNMIYQCIPSYNIVRQISLPYIADGDLFIHSMTSNYQHIFLALSPDKNRFGVSGSYLCHAILQQNVDSTSQLVPISNPISGDTLCMICDIKNGCIEDIQISFNEQKGLLFCVCLVKDQDDIYYSVVLSGFLESVTLIDANNKEYKGFNLILDKVIEKKIVKRGKEYFQNSFFLTSTMLPYYIFVCSQNEGTKIISLPLTQVGKISFQTSDIKDIFFDPLKRFSYREFLSKTSSGDPELVIGGVLEKNCEVKKLKIFGDTIVVLVYHDEKQQWSLFRSMPIFGYTGVIQGWTDWKKIAEIYEPIEDFQLDRLTGKYFFIDSSGRCIKQKIADKDSLIQEAFYKLLQPDSVPVSFIDVQDRYFIATNGVDLLIVDCEKDDDQSILFFKNICESSLFGNLKVVTLVSHDDTGLKMFLGGTEYILEVLYHDNVLDVISTVMIQNSKKIIFDNDILYVLQDNSLYRVVNEKIETLINHNQYGKLVDCVISGSVAVISSSKGIFQVKEGYSIRFGKTEFEKIPIAEVGMSGSLITVSKNGKKNDFARFCGGNLVVLFSDFSLMRSQLYRIAINPVVDTAVVSEKTVHVFNDIMLAKQKIPFLSFAFPEKNFFTDGIRYIFPAKKKQLSLQSFPKLGKTGIGNNIVDIKTDFQSSDILYTGTSYTGSILIGTRYNLYTCI